MFDTFFDAICRVGIFVICAQSIVHFRPKGEYEKYLKLLVNIMILIQLFLPIGSMFFKGEEISVALSEFEEQLKQSVESARESAQAADKRLEEMTLEEVRKRMEEQASENGDSGGALDSGTGETGASDGASETDEGGNMSEDSQTQIEIQIEPVVIE